MLKKSPAGSALKPTSGALFMLSAAFMFGVLDSLVKGIGPSFRIWDIAFFRFTWGMGILLAIFCWRGNPFRGVNHGLLVVRGIVGSISFLSITAAIRLIPLSTAMALFFSYPAFAALFSRILYGERMRVGEQLCIMLIFTGTVVLFGAKLEGQLLGQLLSLLGAVFAGLTVCLVRQLRAKNGPVIIYLYFCLMGSIVAFPAFIADPHLPRTAVDWGFALGIAGLSISAQLLMNQGYKYCKSWEGGIYLTTELLFAAFLAMLLFREPLTMQFIVATVLIFSGIVSLAIIQSKYPSPVIPAKT
jgi:drug/metabolite transporter (DMT)-like permease